MGSQEIICRLCLKLCESFNALEGDMKDFLDKLLPKINLAAVQKPVVCTNCAEIVKKCFDFKAMCFKAHGNIIPFVNNKDAVKLDQIDVPLRRNENNTGVLEDQDICRFCISLQKNCSAISLDVKEGDVLGKMIEKCLPELDLSVNKKPVICTPCYESLEIYFRFVMNCLTVEEKIKQYCETLDISSRGQIELSKLLLFTMRDVTSEANGNSAGIIKVEQFCEERDNADDGEIGKGSAIKLEQMSDNDSEYTKAKVEREIESYMDMTDLKCNNEEQFTPKNMLASKEESDTFGLIKTGETFCRGNEIKEENLVEIEDQKFLLNEEIEIKMDDSDFYKFEDGVVSSHPEDATRLLSSRECLVSNLEGNLSESDIKHTLTKKHVSKVKIQQCDSCSYQTNCKNSLKKHLLKHKDPSEVPVYKCNSCSFQTKYERGLKRHLLMHKDPSEVAIYKCDTCSFQTRNVYNLKEHLSGHMDLSEVTMFKCDFCSFQTRNKFYLKKHSLVHKDPSEVTMYKCDSCSYQSKYERAIKEHLLVHAPQAKMHKCASCPFQTKHKGYLRKHFLRLHENPSEVTMYKCDSCSYETRSRNNLIRHLLVHKDPSEVTTYKCHSCSFQTKYETSLKSHLLGHKDPSEVTMYRCDSCSYQSRRKGDLKQHVLRSHKDSSEITT